MAYCVRCGVELDPKLESCPLCKTPAIDPDTLKPVVLVSEKTQSFYGVSTREFSEMLRQPVSHRISQKTATIFTYTFIVAIIATLLIDILTHNAITWSFYPIISALYAWISLIFPFMFKSSRRFGFVAILAAASIAFLLLLDGFVPPVTWAWYPITSLVLLLVIVTAPVYFGKRYAFPIIIIYTAALALFLWFIAAIAGQHWFLGLGLPLTLLLGGASLLINGFNTLIMRVKTLSHYFISSGVAFSILALVMIGIDVICMIYLPYRNQIGWSYFVGGALLLFAAFLFLAGINGKLRDFLEKNLLP